MMKYQTKVEAIRYRPHENCAEVALFAGDEGDFDAEVCAEELDNSPWMVQLTDGSQEVEPGEWIVKDAFGKLSTCSNEDFETVYEPVEESDE